MVLLTKSILQYLRFVIKHLPKWLYSLWLEWIISQRNYKSNLDGVNFLEENNDFFNQGEVMSDELLKAVKINLNDEQEKQRLSTYLFGMLNGLGRECGAKPTDIQANLIKLLTNKLNYSIESATQLSQFIINSTDREFHPTMFSIIHRGLEGYYM